MYEVPSATAYIILFSNDSAVFKFEQIYSFQRAPDLSNTKYTKKLNLGTMLQIIKNKIEQ